MKNSALFKKLSRLFNTPRRQDNYAYWILVRCNRCGERISTRVDLRNDLSMDYEEGGKETVYYCRKVLMGQNMCFQQVEVHLKFSEKRELLDREINGGSFINAEEFLEQEI